MCHFLLLQLFECLGLGFSDLVQQLLLLCTQLGLCVFRKPVILYWDCTSCKVLDIQSLLQLLLPFVILQGIQVLALRLVTLSDMLEQCQVVLSLPAFSGISPLSLLSRIRPTVVSALKVALVVTVADQRFFILHLKVIVSSIISAHVASLTHIFLLCLFYERR